MVIFIPIDECAILPSMALPTRIEVYQLSTLSHADFNNALDALSSSPGALPHDTQDGGTLAPSSRIPPASNPASRTPARSRPPSPDPLGILGATRDAMCQAYRLAPGTYCEVLQAPRDVLMFPEGNPADWRNLCQSGMQVWCAGAPPGLQPPPPDAPPLVGGQCQGIQYDVAVVTTRFGSGCAPAGNGTGTTRVWGAVLDVRLFDEGQNENFRTQTLEILCFGRGNDPIGELQWVAAGIRSNLSQGCPWPTIVSNVATRVDGLPDDCGDAPPRYRRDRNRPPVIDIDIDIGGSAPVTFAPGITIEGGDISIGLPSLPPVRVDIGGITINPPPPPPPPGQQTPPPPRPAPDTTTIDITINPPPPPPPIDDPAIEEPPEKSVNVIRGVLVTATPVNGGNATVLFQEQNPNVYVPDLGLVSFRCAANEEASGWTEDIRVKNLRQIIECPWSGGAFDVRGTPRQGYVFDLTPIIESIPVEPDP